VDVLVEFQEPVGFLFVHLADRLEELLGLPVDLVTPDAIRPNRRELIFGDLVDVKA
jgi:predicted nucleotidyltransferase